MSSKQQQRGNRAVGVAAASSSATTRGVKVNMHKPGVSPNIPERKLTGEVAVTPLVSHTKESEKLTPKGSFGPVTSAGAFQKNKMESPAQVITMGSPEVAPPLMTRSPARLSLDPRADGGLANAAGRANSIVQEAKDALESKQAGNLKREVREMVVERLQFLHQLIIELAESRNRVISELGRVQVKAAKDADVLRQNYIRKQETQLELYQTFVSKFQGLTTAVEATRNIVGDFRWLDDVKEVKNVITESKKTLSSLSENTNNSAEMAECVRELKQAIAEVNCAGSAAPITYAQVVASAPPPSSMPPAPKHSIVVASSNPKHTGEDVITNVRGTLDARSTGLRVDRVRKASNQKIVITCSSKEDVARVKTRLLGSKTPLKVEEPKQKLPQVVLRDILNYNTDEQVVMSIHKQNSHATEGLTAAEMECRVLYRKRARNQLERNIVLEVTPALWRRLTGAGYVHVDLQRRPVQDQSPLVQCSRCLGYGHTRRFCKETEDSCAHCVGRHSRAGCTKRTEGAAPECCNCALAGIEAREHTAFSGDCPLRRKWDGIARSKVSYC